MITEGKLRDGTLVKIGDEVTTDFHAKCIGKTFIIFEMTEYKCDGGIMCNTHLKGFPDRVLKTAHKEGLSINWFKKVVT